MVGYSSASNFGSGLRYWTSFIPNWPCEQKPNMLHLFGEIQKPDLHIRTGNTFWVLKFTSVVMSQFVWFITSWQENPFHMFSSDVSIFTMDAGRTG